MQPKSSKIRALLDKYRDRFKAARRSGSAQTSSVTAQASVATSTPPPGNAMALGQRTDTSQPHANDVTQNVIALGEASNLDPTLHPGRHVIPKGIAESVIFRGAKTVLSVMKDSVDDIHAPGVKAVLSGVYGCIQVLQKADQNSEDLDMLGQSTSTLISLLSSFGDNLPEPLCSQVNVLTNQMKTIQDKLRNKFGRKGWRKIIDGSDDATEVIQMFRDFSIKVQTFSLYCEMQVAEGINTLILNNTLDNLPRVRDASFQSGDRDGCLDKTREDILKKITKWAMESHGPQIFWLNGMAGVGKTTIAQTVAEILQVEGKLGASFFCSRSHAGRNYVKGIFPTIAYSLARAHPAFTIGIMKAINQNPDVGYYSIDKQFAKLIREPCGLKESEKVTFTIVIDALDECMNSKEIANVLRMLCENAPSCLRFFVASRPEPYIEVYGMNTQTAYLHDVASNVVTHDIQLYLSTKLKGITSLGQPDWPPEDAVGTLVQKAGKLFFYASTMYQF
ncbi:hypothetical protein PLICRDRAFT_664131, partial [Plicaturopsis crispa FD-325 SS-3]